MSIELGNTNASVAEGYGYLADSETCTPHPEINLDLKAVSIRLDSIEVYVSEDLGTVALESSGQIFYRRPCSEASINIGVS